MTLHSQIAPFLRNGKPVPLTYADYANRAGRIPMAQAKGAVDDLARQGIVKREKISGGEPVPVYDLTPLGLALAGLTA